MSDTNSFDWSRLGFALTETDRIFLTTGDVGADEVWSPGELRPFGPLELSPAAAFMSYGQGVFEGLKARRLEDGRIVMFRPDAHAARFERSAERMGMPRFPAPRFVEAVEAVVRSNERWVPPPGAGSFYVRPVQVAHEPRLGLGLCRRFMVVIYGSPVGSYFSGGEVRGLKLRVLEQGRVAPGGTGSAKTLGNYAGTFPMAAHWKERGYDDVLFLDAARLRDVTETVASNVFARLKSGVLVTPPLDDQILPGVTRDSVIRIARDVLGIPVEERPLAVEEVVSDADEAFCTGTAYRLKSIAEVHYRDRVATFGTTGTRDAILEILEEIQLGAREDGYGWMRTVGAEERQT